MLITFLENWSKLAVFQSLGTMPLWMDLWYISTRIGAISRLNSFNTVAGSESGPAALSGYMFCNIFSMPSLLMHISGIVGWGLGPLSAKGPGGSCVNTEVNCWFSISAVFSAELWISLLLRRGETPDIESFHKVLINDQNSFCLVVRSSISMPMGSFVWKWWAPIDL